LEKNIIVMAKVACMIKKGIIKENKGPGRIPKHVSDTREPHSRVDSKHDDAKGDRKHIPKDTRERNRDSCHVRTHICQTQARSVTSS
jgi:hypothetical protein